MFVATRSDMPCCRMLLLIIILAFLVAKNVPVVYGLYCTHSSFVSNDKDGWVTHKDCFAKECIVYICRFGETLYADYKNCATASDECGQMPDKCKHAQPSLGEGSPGPCAVCNTSNSCNVLSLIEDPLKPVIVKTTRAEVVQTKTRATAKPTTTTATEEPTTTTATEEPVLTTTTSTTMTEDIDGDQTESPETKLSVVNVTNTPKKTKNTPRISIGPSNGTKNPATITMASGLPHPGMNGTDQPNETTTTAESSISTQQFLFGIEFGP